MAVIDSFCAKDTYELGEKNRTDGKAGDGDLADW